MSATGLNHTEHNTKRVSPERLAEFDRLMAQGISAVVAAIKPRPDGKREAP
jgi:hypothetical protein